jgi:HK97 family phage prohead protease
MNVQHKRAPLVELKLAGSEQAMEFSGYGAVFGNIDSYGDVIERGAFADTLIAAKRNAEWPAMLMEHGGLGMSADDMVPIGVWTELEEDERGLRVTGRLADTQRGREAYQLLRMEPRPAITGLSIGYVPKEWTPRTRPEEPKRTLKKVELFEVSLVTFPANRSARVADVKGDAITRREIERMLTQDAGLTRSQAREVLSRRFPSLATQDAGPDDDQTAERLARLIETIKA